jgi:serine/threonine protein kinase
MQHLGGMLGLFCGTPAVTVSDTQKVSPSAPVIETVSPREPKGSFDDGACDVPEEWEVKVGPPAARQIMEGNAGQSHGLEPSQEEQEEAPEIVPLTDEKLIEGMEAAASAVEPWDEQRFQRVKQLQEAKRNHGCVELMNEGGTFVAVKKMPRRWIRDTPRQFDERNLDAAERPWADIALVRHLNDIRFPYVVKLIGIFFDDESAYIVSGLASEGDLFGWCDGDPKPGPRREAVMQPLVTQIFKGVQWLHDLGIAHRDLSLENILLHNESGDLKIKIIDFGMATLEQSVTAEIRGKQSYQAPEMHLVAPFDTFMTDPFALGVVLFAMGAQDYPWSSTKRKSCELFEYVCMFGFQKFLSKRRLRKGGGETLAEVFSRPFTELMVGLLAKDPQKRLTLGERRFANADGVPTRSSVWDCKWMHTPLVGASESSSSPVCGRILCDS